MQDTIHYTIYKPSADLAHVVSHYFLYANRLEHWHKEFALSDGCPGLCFALDSPYQFVDAHGVNRNASYAFINGAFTKGLYVYKQASLQTMFGVKFTVDGLYHLIKAPVQDLHQKSVWNAEELLGNVLIDIAEQIRFLPEVVQKIQVLEDYLRKTLQYTNKLPEITFNQVVTTIRENKGQIKVEELTCLFRVNYKWMERKFNQYVGISPKEFARLVRFIHTYFQFRKEGHKDLINIAIANGFYDQNHFIKEFKSFTSYTPTQLLSEPIHDLANIMNHPNNKDKFGYDIKVK